MTGPQAVATLWSNSKSHITQRQSEFKSERQKQSAPASAPGVTPPADNTGQNQQPQPSTAPTDTSTADKNKTVAPKGGAAEETATDKNAAQKAAVAQAAAKAEAQKLSAAGQDAALSGTGSVVDTAKSASTDHSSANASIVDSTRKTLASFTRPIDVGCAMSILSWSETRYAFGRLIANEYIGVQIVVRNISDQQEFLLHDAAVAVDSDLRDARDVTSRAAIRLSSGL